MVFFVIFSTLSFSVEKHFCGSYLVDSAIFSKVKNCGMKINSETAMKKNCCKDKVEIIKGQDDLKIPVFDDLFFSQQLVFIAFSHALY